MKIDRIISLVIVGGFLDGARVEFAPGLNCIIGARGTGKTTLLELIRYTLNALPRKDLSPAARRRVESLVEGNLQGGRVELDIETRDGLRYFITRAVGEEPIVLDAKRNPTSLSLDGHAFFRADIFSQNEVETIADHSRFQLELIDSFARDEIAEMDRAVSDIVLQVASQAKQVEPLNARLAFLNEEIKQLPIIEERLKTFAAKGDETAETVNRAHALKALRDREIRAVTSATDLLSNLAENLASLTGRFKAELGGKFSREMIDGPNGKLVSAIYEQLRTCAKSVDESLRAAQHAVTQCDGAVETTAAALKMAHQEQELAFRELVEKHKQHQTQSTERADLERKRNKIVEFKNEAAEIQKQIRNAEKQRIALLTKLSEAKDKRFRLRKAMADRLNGALAPNITVSIQQDGTADAYCELIESSLKKTGIRQGMVAQKLLRTLPPAQLAGLVRAGDPTALMERGDLNADQATKVIAAFNTPEKLAELETVELQDAPTIRLKVGDQEKDSATLSTGQKCTTILPILLLEGGNPLRIAHPEDNLDNRFIFETVVDNIHKVKQVRQLIFVTHNPNIPVLGEASRVFVMESDGDRARPAAAGSVDDCKNHIVTLLEGGADAFRRRGARYQV